MNDPININQFGWLYGVQIQTAETALKCHGCQSGDGRDFKHSERKIQKGDKHLRFNYFHGNINVCKDCIAIINKEVNG